MKTPDKTFMPVREYAEREGITVQAVYQAIKRGSIEVKKIGSFTLVAV